MKYDNKVANNMVDHRKISPRADELLTRRAAKPNTVAPVANAINQQPITVTVEGLMFVS